MEHPVIYRLFAVKNNWEDKILKPMIIVIFVVKVFVFFIVALDFILLTVTDSTHTGEGAGELLFSPSLFFPFFVWPLFHNILLLLATIFTTEKIWQ